MDVLGAGNHDFAPYPSYPSAKVFAKVVALWQNMRAPIHGKEKRIGEAHKLIRSSWS